MNTLSNPALERSVWDADVDTRATFITRTYMHLLGAIVAFVLLELALFQAGIPEKIAPHMVGNAWLLVLGGFMLVSWLGSRVAHTARSKVAQYAALALFVAAEALIFVPLLWMAFEFAPGAISSAAMVTAGGFVVLTAIVFITRKDFSFMRGILMFGGVAALGLIVCGVIFGFELGLYFSFAMVAFASGAVLYDTSNVLHHYPEDRYVGAALELFASVALLFWYVLRIFIGSRD